MDIVNCNERCKRCCTIKHPDDSDKMNLCQVPTVIKCFTLNKDSNKWI